MGSSGFSFKLGDHPKLPKGKTVAVVVLDGWGEAKPDQYNCISVADTPTMDSLKQGAPERWRLVKAHGTAVGLPTEDDMGNSEVGHNALGAGRIYAQGAKLVDLALASGKIYEGEGFKYINECFENGTLHLIGLLSDGGVHSRLDQLLLLLKGCSEHNAKRIRVHILTDGRDVLDGSSVGFVETLENELAKLQRLAQQGPTTSIGRSPPVSPRSAATTLESPPSDSSAQITDNSGLVGGTSPSRRAPPPPPATSIARAQANRSKQGSQSTTPATPAQYPTHDSSQKKVVPPPMALAAALPEPADPPAADEVALATPDNADAALAHNNANSGSSTDAVGTAANMRQVGARDYDEEDAMVASPITSDDEDAHRGDAFRTPTDENPPAIAAGSDSQSPYRRNAVAAAGVGAGAAGLGAAAALSSSSGSSSDYSPRRARDAQNAAPHSAYNMTGAGAFNEKDSRSDDRALLAGGAGAGVGAAAANRSYKPLNEGSRQGWSDSPGATGAGAGGAGGSALGRSWRAHKKRWIIGIVLLLIVILAAAIGGGVAGSSGGSSSNSGSSGSNSGSGSGSGTGTSNGGGTTSGGIGPLDSRLSRSFYGINYSPQESNVGFGCGSNITGVIHDVTILSQLTSRVRLTGSACNQTALVLDAIQRLGVDMQVWAGIDLDSETTLTGTAFTGQLANLTYAFDTFGTSNIAGIYVGDEYVTSFGSAASLERFITATRDLVADNSAWGNVLVGTAETASTWSTTLAEQVDFVFANDESWDEGVTGTEAAEYSYQTFQDFVVSQATDASNDPPTYVSAIGWPTADQDGDSTTIESLANLQSFLDAYVCDANTNGTGYFWFELFDDPEVEIAATGGTPNTASPGYWGLFDSDKNLKDLTLPDCAL